MAVRVALADASFLVREALAGLLAGMPDVELVAACRNADELRAAVDDASPDIVLTEIPMPPSMTDEGLRLAAELRETHPETAVIALSDQCDPAYALALLESGADRRAYLLKERLHTPRQLLAAIETVASGGSLIDAKVVEALIDRRQDFERSLLADLTAEERATLVEMARGSSNAAIARRLGINQRTVERQIHTIFEKLELPSTPEVNRRVRAVLLYLATRGATARARPARRPPRPGTAASP
jgi:DNA-binding NarL/FixJ family response regulator